MFLTLLPADLGKVTFGDNKKGIIKGIGTVGKEDATKIHNVYYVDGLKHNLLSISQLCDSGYDVVFQANLCIVKNLKTGKELLTGVRTRNVYTVQLSNLSNHTCLASFEEDKWLWHRRVGHANMQLISKLVSQHLFCSFLNSCLCHYTSSI